MHIRIARTFIEGNVQFTLDQVLDLPEELAQSFLDAGDAVELAKDERVPPTRPALSGFVAPQRLTKPKPRGR